MKCDLDLLQFIIVFCATMHCLAPRSGSVCSTISALPQTRLEPKLFLLSEILRQPSCPDLDQPTVGLPSGTANLLLGCVQPGCQPAQRGRESWLRIEICVDLLVRLSRELINRLPSQSGRRRHWRSPFPACPSPCMDSISPSGVPSVQPGLRVSVGASSWNSLYKSSPKS